MKQPKSVGKFVICIRNEECDDLEPRKLYRVIPDKAAAAEGLQLTVRQHVSQVVFSLQLGW